MNRLNQLTKITRMIQPNQSINSIYCNFFWKPSISLVDIFWEAFDFVDLCLAFFESIELIQSYQSFKVNRLNPLLYENKLTQSPINSLGKEIESNQYILQKIMNRFKSVDSIKLIGIGISLVGNVAERHHEKYTNDCGCDNCSVHSPVYDWLGWV